MKFLLTILVAAFVIWAATSFSQGTNKALQNTTDKINAAGSSIPGN